MFFFLRGEVGGKFVVRDFFFCSQGRRISRPLRQDFRSWPICNWARSRKEGRCSGGIYLFCRLWGRQIRVVERDPQCLRGVGRWKRTFKDACWFSWQYAADFLNNTDPGRKLEGTNLFFKVAAGATYTGELAGDTLTGEWTQPRLTKPLPLVLTRVRDRLGRIAAPIVQELTAQAAAPYLGLIGSSRNKDRSSSFSTRVVWRLKLRG